MKKIVLISGKSKAGKDYITSKLAEHLPALKLKLEHTATSSDATNTTEYVIFLSDWKSRKLVRIRLEGEKKNLVQIQQYFVEC